MGSVATQYALRSVWRNSRRTLLAIVGIGVGCALALFMESLNRGRDELFARAGAEGGTGHLRIVPEGWRARRDPRLRLADWRADLDAARALPGVLVATPRVRAEVLLAMGTHVVPVEMVGVAPETEPRAFRFVRNLAAGRYLAPGERGAVVIGRAIADRLSVEVGDDVLASAVGQGGRIESGMFRVAGIAASGSDEIDAGICQVSLADVAELTGIAGAGEITVLLADWRAADTSRDALVARLRAPDKVLTWGEISPEFKGHLEQDKATSRLVSGIILLIVFLGVASAQLAAVLERRREFAVLSALGMSAGRMVQLVLQEGIALGLGGAVLGLALALPFLWRFSRSGLDLRRWIGGASTFQGVIFDPIIYGSVGAWIAPYVLTVAVGATLLASVYPAWFAARTDPATALRVAQ
jgi:ABC-type lipoprotein release transport system permease subunit